MEIIFPGFTSLVKLVGVDGQSQILPKEDYWYLDGFFQLQVAGFDSDPTQFSSGENAVTVDKTADGTWQLRTAPAGTRFGFETKRIKFQSPDQIGPWAQSDSVWIVKKLGLLPLISLHTLCISLVAEADYVGSSFIFPSAAGTQTIDLTQDSDGIYRGHFLRPQADAFIVTAGSPREAARMDHVQGMALMFPADLSFNFRVANNKSGKLDLATSKLEVDATEAANGVRLSVYDTTLLELRKRVEANDGSYMRVDKLEVAGSWISGLRFADEHVKLRRRPSTAMGPTDDSTRVFGPAERFAVHVPLVADGALKAQFVYRDESVRQDSKIATPSPRDAHYGLRVEGLGWAKGGNLGPGESYAKLDADWLTVTLEQTKFEYRAGGNLTVRDQEITDSLLVPKPNRARDNRRVLEVPLEGMMLKCDAGTRPDTSPLLFDTGKATNQFVFTQVALLGPPVGASASASAQLFMRDGNLQEEANYAQWKLKLKRPNGDESLAFDVTSEGAFPSEKEKWLDAFGSDSTEDFRLLEHPGARLAIDPPSDRLKAALARDVKTKLVAKTEFEGGSLREKAVYSAVCLALSYPLIKHLLPSGQQSLPEDNIVLKAVDLEKDASKDWVKKNEGPGRLVVVYYNQDGRIKEFIDDNTPSGAGVTEFLWPVVSNLAIVLWQEKKGHPRKYCYQLAEERGAPNTALAFDFSDAEQFEASDMGWAGGWKTIQDEDPDLWPRRGQMGKPAEGAHLDPSDIRWRGIMFRDMPLSLILSDKTLKQIEPFAFLKKLFELVNNTLVLEYGWKAEAGTSWKASAKYEAADSGSITPEGWDKFIQLSLLKFAVKGAQGKVLRSEGKLLVKFPLIKKKNSNEPIELKGSFSIKIADGVAVEQFELVPDIGGRIETTSIPGFEKIEVMRFSTDFKSGRLYLKLYPEEALATALPFLKQGQPLDAQVAFNFSGTPLFDLALLLPAESQTNLFGKWHVTVQGIRVRFQAGGLTETIVGCRLNLGLPGFSSVGCQVALTKRADNPWSLKVLIDRISGSLDMFGFHAGLDVKWSTLDDVLTPDPSGLPQGNIGDGAARDIWGKLSLKHETGFLGGPHSMHFRIGTKGEMSYWVAALRIGETISIGTAELGFPVLVVSRNADYKGLLAKELADASNDVMLKLRPEIKEGKEFNWIASWQPTDKVGTFIGVSGYLSLHPEVLTVPKAQSGSEPDAKYLSAFGLTSSGLIRIDAAGLFMKTLPVRFSLGLDLNNKILTAAFALTDKIEHGEFAIQPGQILIGIGYGDKRYFLVGLGWPPRVGGDEFERDWSKSIMIRWDNTVPINTFWGGFRAEYNGVKQYIALGYAIRAGWTKSYKRELAVLKGEAELGVAVGGVFEFRYSWGEHSRLLVPMRPNLLLEAAGEEFSRRKLPPVWREKDPVLATAIFEWQPEIEAALAGMARGDFDLEATYYADIWGSASGSILGVTVASVEVRAYARLHLCAGTSSRSLISRVAGRLGFFLRIKILCFVIKVEASIDIVLLDGSCHASRYFGAVPSFEQPLLTE